MLFHPFLCWFQEKFKHWEQNTKLLLGQGTIYHYGQRVCLVEASPRRLLITWFMLTIGWYTNQMGNGFPLLLYIHVCQTFMVSTKAFCWMFLPSHQLQADAPSGELIGWGQSCASFSCHHSHQSSHLPRIKIIIPCQFSPLYHIVSFRPVIGMSSAWGYHRYHWNSKQWPNGLQTELLSSCWKDVLSRGWTPQLRIVRIPGLDSGRKILMKRL